MFFVYKNRFLARQIRPVMAFIPDNISVHVHLLEDRPDKKKKEKKEKKKRWLLSAGFFFSLADFPQKQQECFSEDHYWFISVDSVGRERSKLFSSCGPHFRSGDKIFSVQIATTTVCITRKMYLYRHLSRFLGRSLDFSSV